METLIDLLRATCAAHRDKTALSLHSGLSEDAWSYDRLWNAAHAVARHMRQAVGLAAGERVIVWGPNCPELVATYFGVMLARLIVVPMDPSAKPEYLGRIAERTKAVAVVTGFAPPDLPGVRIIQLTDLPFGAPGSLIEDYPAPHEIAEIVFTSGTTGEPKGVILTHANIVADVRASGNFIPSDSRYRMLSILPLSHMFEQTAGLFVPLSFGSTIFYSQSRQAGMMLKVFQQHHITIMAVVPQVLRLLLDSIEREVNRQGKTRQWQRAHQLAEHLPMALRRRIFHDVHDKLGGAFQFFICGGAYLPPSLAMAWERMGIKVVQGYGATECAPIISGNTLRRRVNGSVGTVMPGMEVRLSAEGEILVKGANVTQGYWQDEAATREAFTADGWYRTGDIGEIGRRGNIYLKGHLKDIVVLASGLNVYPEDVERVLKAEEEVVDCIVLGLRDAAGNARVHAVVIPAVTSGDEHGRIDQAVRRSNARLSPHQRIKSFTLWEGVDFPRTNTLKVKRHEVLVGSATSRGGSAAGD
jgi:long-chain acyl-CoA synthetase